MEARAKFMGHPVHPMLVVLPLGLLAGAVFFDIVHLLTGGETWSVVSYWLIPPGVVTGVVAAVFGTIDWLAIPRRTRAKRVGWMHAATNVLVLVLFGVSWWIRPSATVDPGVPAILLSVCGGGAALVSGWLGGELVDRLGVGVDEGAHLDAPNSLSEPRAADRA